MYNLVNSQIPFLGKFFPARLTSVLFLSCMKSMMFV